MGAPAAAVYKTHSTSIVDALEDLKDKPEGELADLRKAEANAQHNYDMLEQSLEDLKAADRKTPTCGRPKPARSTTMTCSSRVWKI